jgi:hypothetical protein
LSFLSVVGQFEMAFAKHHARTGYGHPHLWFFRAQSVVDGKDKPYHDTDRLCDIFKLT